MQTNNALLESLEKNSKSVSDLQLLNIFAESHVELEKQK